MPGLGTCEAGACETFQDCDWMPIGRKRRKRAKEKGKFVRSGECAGCDPVAEGEFGVQN